MRTRRDGARAGTSVPLLRENPRAEDATTAGRRAMTRRDTPAPLANAGGRAPARARLTTFAVARACRDSGPCGSSRAASPRSRPARADQPVRRTRPTAGATEGPPACTARRGSCSCAGRGGLRLRGTRALSAAARAVPRRSRRCGYRARRRAGGRTPGTPEACDLSPHCRPPRAPGSRAAPAARRRAASAEGGDRPRGSRPETYSRSRRGRSARRGSAPTVMVRRSRARRGGARGWGSRRRG